MEVARFAYLYYDQITPPSDRQMIIEGQTDSEVGFRYASCLVYFTYRIGSRFNG